MIGSVRTPALVGALSAVALLLAIQVTPAPALDLGEWVPGLTLTPFFSEKVEYETNVFQEHSHAKDDVIFRSIPGILVDYTTGPLSLSAGYRLEALRFLDMDSQDAEHHFAVGQIRLDLPKLLINLRDDYARSSDPPGTELTGRIKSTTNTLAPEAEYRLTERFSVGGNYAWTRVDFDSINELDRDEHLMGGSVFWKFLPKSDLRFSYNYGVKEFDKESFRDVTRHIVVVGLRGDITARLSSTFRLGYEVREADQSSMKGYHGLVAGGDWVYRPTERTRISLLTDRKVEESVFAQALYYVSTVGTLLAEHQFLPKVTGRARFTLGENEYPTKATINGFTKWRYDALLGLGAGVDYELQRWLRLSAEYSHTRRESNFSLFSFKDDKVSGTVTFQF